MVDPQIIKDTAEAIGKIIPVDKVYEDAIQPVAKEVGKSLKTVGGVINIALSPLAAVVYGYGLIADNLKKRLEEKLSNIDPKNIVSPPLRIIGPIIEKYKYVHDDNYLSDMFVNLLANAMDKNTVKNAHPAFVNIISEMSPDEAKLILYMSKQKILPKIDVVFSRPNEKGHNTALTNFSLLGEQAKLTHPELTPAYLDGLERNKIIVCTDGSFGDSYAHKEYYEPLKKHRQIKEIEDAISKIKGKVTFYEGIIKITAFGNMFISAVKGKK